jgi:hypothetical protein
MFQHWLDARSEHTDFEDRMEQVVWKTVDWAIRLSALVFRQRTIQVHLVLAIAGCLV